MRDLLSSEYFPFGSQYYRAPSPHEDDWERDLKNMAGLGFNTVKFWVQWRWNHPQENKFYFDDIDRLMDLAHDNKLRVMLNTIFDVAPAWIYRKYADASMLTLDGRRIGPQTQPHRQIGGLGWCFNHEQVAEHMFRFLAETVRRYKEHPALEIWNVGSEPELTNSMNELRRYANDLSKVGDMLCFCEHCQRAFKKWLAQKYGAIDKLNLAWNRNYTSFDDAELPKTRNTFNDMIDWRMFFVHTLGENVKRRFDVAKAEDRGKHPLMCHHVFIQGFPLISTANDPWNVGQYGDLHGFTQRDDAMMSDILRSCAKDKPVISAEMLMLPGYTLDLHRTIGMNEIKRFVFTGVAANQKGFIFWQYRPELLGREAPTWGLTYLDGSPTPWLKNFSEVGRVLQKNAAFLLDAKPRPADVAMIYNPENQVFAWASTGRESTATNSLLGTHRALYLRNFTVDFLHPREFETPAILKNYKVVYVAFPYCLNEKICAELKKWVADGGILIGEAYFAGWQLEQGRHQPVVPGYGLDEVFQVRQGTVDPPEDGRVEVSAVHNLPYFQIGQKAHGALVQERFLLEGAETLATFHDESPAATAADYGKGKAILIGTYLGLPAFEQNLRENEDFIAGLVEMTGGIDRPVEVGGSRVRIDILHTNKNESMLILQNHESRAVRATIQLPCGMAENKLVEQFTGAKLTFARDQKRCLAPVTLQAGEVRVYRG